MSIPAPAQFVNSAKSIHPPTSPENLNLRSFEGRIYGGRTLAERVAEALVNEEYAFAFEFYAGGREEVYGCYYADDLTTPVYSLEAIGGFITSCNCEDHRYRKRVCKHQIQLALMLDYGILVAGLPPVGPARLFHRPLSAYEGAHLRAMTTSPAAITRDELISAAILLAHDADTRRMEMLQGRNLTRGRDMTQGRSQQREIGSQQREMGGVQ